MISTLTALEGEKSLMSTYHPLSEQFQMQQF